MPVLIQFLGWLTGSGIPALEKIGGVIGTVAADFGKLVEWFKQGSVPALAIGVALAVVASGLAAIKIGAFIAAIPGLVTGFLTWAASAWTAAAATIAATWPLFAIGAAVALVVVGIILAVKNWGAIVTWLGNLWHTVLNWMGNLWATVSGWIGARFSWLGDHVHGIINAIGGLFSWIGNQFSKLGSFFHAVGAAIGGIFSWIGGLIHNEIVGWEMLFSWIGNRFSALGSFFQTIAGAIGSAFSGLGPP